MSPFSSKTWPNGAVWLSDNRAFGVLLIGALALTMLMRVPAVHRR
jgi:hypothetical protein